MAALSLTMPVWQAAMAVGAVLVIAGAAALYYCLGRMKYNAQLERFPRSVETNSKFLKEQLT